MESNEKKYTLEDVKASTQEAEAARYRFVGCMYKTLKEELGEEQANDLIAYIREGEKSEEGAWETNIFGKSIGELMENGIRGKISMMDDECQMKLQDTMQKIVNDNNGGMVCIIL